jgi:anthranilate synthase
MLHSHAYTTAGGVRVERHATELPFASALDGLTKRLDGRRGALLTSSYDYPGRYKRWSTGFADPPLGIESRGTSFTMTAYNARGEILLAVLRPALVDHPDVASLDGTKTRLAGELRAAEAVLDEAQRSRQPSIFGVLRAAMTVFASEEDGSLGFYAAFGYDLIFQFEPVENRREGPADQRDVVAFLPDEVVVVDNQRQHAVRLSYEFVTKHGATAGLARTGDDIDYRGAKLQPARRSDYPEGGYAAQVEEALEYFRRGDLFEVVTSQSFYEACDVPPSVLFETLRRINPSPYGFLFNLGGEYLIGASPEMFVRVEGMRVETCPISGTIRRGRDAIEDAERIRTLLNSAKDEAELTMCTDVDRNDKSRVCVPGSVKVIGRRQIELYSHLIHTVDHVEGELKPGFDGLDAFLSHAWAVTVTGAPKRAATQFLEHHEISSRRFYGGAVGCLGFNGNVNTGLTLRTIRLKDSIAEIRVGATLLYDSIPAEEERETHTKAAALYETLRRARLEAAGPIAAPTPPIGPGAGKRILLIDCEDSFVHTLASYFAATGAEVLVCRHNHAGKRLAEGGWDLVVLSPGPGRPEQFGVPGFVHDSLRRGYPVFGVCLGLQGIVEALGGRLGILPVPQHGKPAETRLTGAPSRLFRGLPEQFTVGRYHSLFAEPGDLPASLQATALSADGCIMAVEHRDLPLAAVQFHPESIMTIEGGIGHRIVENVLTELCAAPQLPRAAE